MKKSLSLLMILSGIVSFIVAENAPKLDTIRFWEAVNESPKIKDNPIFQEHALTTLHRLQTERKNAGLTTKGTKGSSLFGDLRNKYNEFKEKQAAKKSVAQHKTAERKHVEHKKTEAHKAREHKKVERKHHPKKEAK